MQESSKNVRKVWYCRHVRKIDKSKGEKMKIMSVQPKLGMTATICGLSERYSGTITELVLSAYGPRKGNVRMITVKADEDGGESSFSLRNNGSWIQVWHEGNNRSLTFGV